MPKDSVNFLKLEARLYELIDSNDRLEVAFAIIYRR